MTCRLFCFAPFGGNYAVHHQVDMVIAAGVKIKGGEVVTVGCNSLFENCEAVMHSKPDVRAIDCTNCAIKGRGLLSFGGLPFFTLNELVTPEEIQALSQWSKTQTPPDWKNCILEGDELGKWCLSSLLTGFQISQRELDRQDIIPFYQSLLRNSALTALGVKRVITSYNPTVATVFNGRFAQYRTAYEILRRAGIRVITHERGFADNTFLFYDNAIISETKEFFAISRPWQTQPLSVPQLERVREYIQGRELGKDFNTPAFITYTTDELSIRKQLVVDGRPLLGFFSSTESEMAQTEDSNIANVQIPLLRRLIKGFAERPEVIFVVRHHPNLVGSPHHPPEYGFITELYKTLIDAPSNVCTIMPTEKISSYALMWSLEGAVVPFSSVGLEVTSRGSASMASQYNPYELAQSLTFGDLNKFDAVNAIEKLVSLSQNFNEDILRKAYRFIYTYIERVSVRFKSFGIKDFYDFDISPEFIDNLSSDSDPNLSRIISGILHNQPIYPTPQNSESHFNEKQETDFLVEQVAKIKAKKKDIYLKSTSAKIEYPKVLQICHTPRQSIFPDIFGDRYPNVDRQDLNYEGTIAETCHQILNILESTNCHFVAYAHPSVSFDGNFISSGIDFLSQPANQQKSLLLRGMWLANSEGKIHSDFLSARQGELNKISIKNYLGDSIDPLLLVSWGIYRTETLRSLLLQIKESTTADQALDTIIATWQKPETEIWRFQCGVSVLSA